MADDPKKPSATFLFRDHHLRDHLTRESLRNILLGQSIPLELSDSKEALLLKFNPLRRGIKQRDVLFLAYPIHSNAIAAQPLRDIQRDLGLHWRGGRRSDTIKNIAHFVDTGEKLPPIGINKSSARGSTKSKSLNTDADTFDSDSDLTDTIEVGPIHLEKASELGAHSIAHSEVEHGAESDGDEIRLDDAQFQKMAALAEQLGGNESNAGWFAEKGLLVQGSGVNSEVDVEQDQDKSEDENEEEDEDDVIPVTPAQLQMASGMAGDYHDSVSVKVESIDGESVASASDAAAHKKSMAISPSDKSSAVSPGPSWTTLPQQPSSLQSLVVDAHPLKGVSDLKRSASESNSTALKRSRTAT